jgi:hypothetical protein
LRRILFLQVFEFNTHIPNFPMDQANLQWIWTSFIGHTLLSLLIWNFRWYLTHFYLPTVMVFDFHRLHIGLHVISKNQFKVSQCIFCIFATRPLLHIKFATIEDCSSYICLIFKKITGTYVNSQWVVSYTIFSS